MFLYQIWLFSLKHSGNTGNAGCSRGQLIINKTDNQYSHTNKPTHTCVCVCPALTFLSILHIISLKNFCLVKRNLPLFHFLFIFIVVHCQSERERVGEHTLESIDSSSGRAAAEAGQQQRQGSSSAAHS